MPELNLDLTSIIWLPEVYTYISEFLAKIEEVFANLYLWH